MPGLHFDITADNKVFIRSVDEIERSVRNASEQIEKEGGDIEAIFARMKRAASLAAAGFSLKEFVGKVASARGEFQQLEVAFNTMFGSEEKAVALMDQLVKTAATTPFDLQGIANGAKQLLAYGTNAEDVNGTLIRLGDIAAGLSIPLGDLVYLYGTTMAQGRLYTQDLNQFTGRGIPMIGELAKQFGVAESEVKKLVEEGKVGFPEVQKVIESLTNEGGKFGGLMEAQSKTIVGQISNIEDAIDSMFNEIGKSSEGIINDSLGLISSLVDNWETVGKIILTVVSTYGTYKAAVIAVAAAHKMAAIWGEVQAFLSLAKSVTSAKDAMLLLNMVTSANPIGLILGVVGAAAASFALFSKNADKASTMTEKFGTSAATAISKIDTLSKILQGSSDNSELHAKVMDELNGVLQEYGLEALNESASIDEVNRKREKAIALIKEEAVERQRANALEQGQQDYVNALKSAKEQLLSDLSNATTGREILGLDFSFANDEIRDNASAISAIIGDLVERNISEIAGKTGKEYEDGVKKIYDQIGERMKAIGLSEETISSVWKDGGFLMVDDLINKYIDKVKEAKEEHTRFTDAIEKSAKAEKDAAEVAMSFEEKVEAVSKRLAGAGDDVHGLYKRIKDLMSQYSENTIGFTIKFSNDIPEWMNSKKLPELQKLAARFTALGNKATDAGLTIGDTHWTKQQLLQRGADYAQAAENKQSAIDEKKRKENSKTDAEKRKAEKEAQDARKQAAKRKEDAAKLADLMRKQAQERLQIELDYEYERWQSRIDLMEEGEAKVLAQQELNNSKELSDLNRRKQQEIAAETERQKAVFDAKKKAGQASGQFAVDQTEINSIEARYAALQADLTQKQQKAESDRQKAAKESMNAYLKEFGNYQQKRLAIEQEYQAKIQSAENEGQRMQLTAQRDKALSDLDYSEWVDSGSIALAFGDISKLSDRTITQLIADMEKYREKVIATFDPDKIQKYEDALNDLRAVQADNSFGIFSSVVPEYFKQRKSVAGQKDSAAENVNALYEQRVTLLEKIKRLEDLIEVTGANGYDTSNLATQLREAKVQLDANTTASEKAKNAFQQLQEQWDKLDSPEEKFRGLVTAISSVGSEVIGVANAVTDMLSSFGVEIPEEVGTIIDGLGNAIDGLGSMDMTRPFSIVTGAFKTLSGIGKTIGGLFGLFSGDKKHEKNIQRLQKQIDALQKSYDRLGNAADDAFSTDASDLIDQQNTLLQQQKVLIKQQMAEEEAKKKTDKDKIKQYKERLEEIDEILEENSKKAKEAIIGEDIKSAINEFAGTYASAWEDGTDAASKSMAAVKSIITSALTELLKKNIQPAAQSFYDTLAKAMEDGILTDSELAALDAIKVQMDVLAASGEEQYKKIQERYKDLDELREELTDISFNSVRDNFKSQLMDMEADASDFTEDFGDMLRNAMIKNLMDNKYDAMLKKWYEEFAKAMDDQTLTYEERERLRQQYDAIVQQGIADRNAINDFVGGGAYSQETSKGWAATMSQDTGDELNGRFTALTELQVMNNDLTQTQNIMVSQILATLRGMGVLTSPDGGQNDTLREMRDMMFRSTGFLEDIAKYTKILNSVDERLVTLNSTIDRKL